MASGLVALAVARPVTTSADSPRLAIDVVTPQVTAGQAAAVGLDASAMQRCALRLSGPGGAAAGPFTARPRGAHLTWRWTVPAHVRPGLWRAAVSCYRPVSRAAHPQGLRTSTVLAAVAPTAGSAPLARPAGVRLLFTTPGAVVTGGVAGPGAPAAGGPPCRLGPGGYCTGYCTAYAWSRRPDLPQGMGDATGWREAAAAAGFAIHSRPQPGDVAWWSAARLHNPWGHVAYVERVAADGTVVTSDMNDPTWNVVATHVYRPDDPRAAQAYIGHQS